MAVKDTGDLPRKGELGCDGIVGAAKPRRHGKKEDPANHAGRRAAEPSYAP
jgi:hypothetical protein